MSNKPATPYLDNLNIDTRMIGLGMTLCPFIGNNSASRSDMFSGHLDQYQIPRKGEHPLVFTGYESIVADYDFNTADIDQNIRIIEIIPRYQSVIGQNNIRFNPFITVIYIGEDEKISYFNLYKYTKTVDGYGYANKWMNEEKLMKDSFVPKGTRFYTSTARDGEEYKIGVNANVAYMTMLETGDDAFIISESLAKSLQPISIKTISIKIDPKQYPINIYGTPEEIKFFPDIGETVRDDGILTAFRKLTPHGLISDLNDASMYSPQYLFDDCAYVPAGAMVIGVETYVKKGKTNLDIFKQLEKYQEATIRYYKSIIDTYHANHGRQMSPKYNTLVTNAISRVLASGIPVKGMKKKASLELLDKDTPIEMQLDITIMYSKPVNTGYKLTGRDGAKGVLAIWKDEDMPVDENGIRADIIKDTMTVVKRTNLGQLYEQDINRHLEFRRQHIINSNMGLDDAFNTIIEILNDINPNYAKLVSEACIDIEAKTKFVEDSLKKGIGVNIPPSLNTINSNLPILLEDKYGAYPTPVTYHIYTKEGKRKKITTKNSVLIGKKYIYLLYKMPRCSACGGGYINQCRTPVHPSKFGDIHFPVHQTPTRFGEDEFRILFIAVGAEPTVRLRTLIGNSLKGINTTIQTILESKHPSQIRRMPISTEELKDDDFIITIANNMFKIAGIRSDEVLLKPTIENTTIEGLTTDQIDEINKYLRKGK